MGFSVSDGWSSTGGISSTKNGLKWYAPPKTKKISPLKRIFLLETCIFRFHVCFREGIWDETMIVRVHLRNLGNIFIYCFNVFSPIWYPHILDWFLSIPFNRNKRWVFLTILWTKKTQESVEVYHQGASIATARSACSANPEGSIAPWRATRHQWISRCG